MRDHRPTLTNQLLTSNKLNSLTKKIDDILEINKILEDILPATLASQCRVANLKNNYLTIQVASSSLQMKLNYERMVILSKLRERGFANLISIDIRVNPELYKIPATPQQKEKILKKLNL